MIHYEIYPNKGPVSFIIYIFWSLWIWFFGLYLFLIINGKPLIIDNQLSVLGCELIFTSFYIIIFITYVIKVIYNHYHQDDDN